MTVDEATTIESLDKARTLLEAEVGEENVSMAGSAVNTAATTESTNKEVTQIIMIIIPICFIILFLTTSSWFEPVLFSQVLNPV